MVVEEGYGHYREPFITTLAPSALRKALKEAPSKGDHADMGALAQEVVETQLLIYQEHKLKASQRPKQVPTLFDSVLDRISDSLGDDAEEDLRLLQSIPDDVVRRAIWKWFKLPYSVFCAYQAKAHTGEEQEFQVDEWILENERWLRDDKPESWTHGLVKLSRHAGHIFVSSTVSETSRTVTRSPTLDGYTFLDKKRAGTVKIQPSTSAFGQKFEQLSNGLLRGLDWENVCVAGGIVFGSILSVNEPEHVGISDQWKNSDIDIYLYGLSPVQANQKLRHIFDVFKSNLPTGAPSLVVRNSKTITFFSNYPLRRIQVVLKKVDSPREVLLNFDLDICSMAWDGTEVWMLPRACRALQTGYNIFTMNLIHGHYLGERRASQEQRVFKYASKGYGLRILPSYLESLPSSEQQRKKLNTKKNKLQELDPPKIAERARTWTDKIVARYLEWNHTNQLTYAGSGWYKQPKLKILDRTLPVFTHFLLDFREQKTAEPANRSCLTGFELLMRHVRLWEKECAGKLRIQDDVWASTSYPEMDSTMAYDDAPKYEWDDSFTIEGLQNALDRFNRDERSEFLNNGNHDIQNITIRRSTYASSVDEILQPQCDIVHGLFVPPNFRAFANMVVSQALKDNALNPGEVEPLQVVEHLQQPDDDDVDTCLWRIGSLDMWQLVDRRIDEVNEVLWSLRRTNERMETVCHSDRMMLFKSQASRRAIRKTVADEFTEFARWLGRKPINGASNYPGIGQGFWEEEDLPDYESNLRWEQGLPPLPSDDDDDPEEGGAAEVTREGD